MLTGDEHTCEPQIKSTTRMPSTCRPSSQRPPPPLQNPSPPLCTLHRRLPPLLLVPAALAPDCLRSLPTASPLPRCPVPHMNKLHVGLLELACVPGVGLNVLVGNIKLAGCHVHTWTKSGGEAGGEAGVPPSWNSPFATAMWRVKRPPSLMCHTFSQPLPCTPTQTEPTPLTV